MLSAFKLLNTTHESSSRRLNILEKELDDCKSSYEATLQQLHSAVEENSVLQHRLDQADNEFTQRQAEADNFKKEKNKLESELQEVRQAEEQSHKEVRQIYSEIKEKEQLVQQLSLELRRLNSMKTIHEMKSKDYTAETIDRCRKSRMTPRKSVPHRPIFSVNSPLSSPMSKAFTFEAKVDGINLIGEQRNRLKSQAIGIKTKQAELDEREIKLKQIEESLKKRQGSQMKALIDECEGLKAKVIQLEAKNFELQAELIESEAPSEAGPTLYSEIQQSEPNDTRESIRSRPRETNDKSKDIVIKQYEAELLSANAKSRARCCSFW